MSAFFCPPFGRGGALTPYCGFKRFKNRFNARLRGIPGHAAHPHFHRSAGNAAFSRPEGGLSWR